MYLQCSTLRGGHGSQNSTLGQQRCDSPASHRAQQMSLISGDALLLDVSAEAMTLKPAKPSRIRGLAKNTAQLVTCLPC